MILLNILGGLIVSAFTAIIIWLRQRMNRYHLRRLLGHRFSEGSDVRIVYGQLTLPACFDKNGKRITHPYKKYSRRSAELSLQGGFSMIHPVSECEVRALTHLTRFLSYQGNLSPLIVSDLDADSLVDANLIALGLAKSNYKTEDILKSSANIFENKKPGPKAPVHRLLPVERQAVLTMAKFARPRTPNDNPFVESAFGTVKQSSRYPGRFLDLTEAVDYFDRFFPWYNQDHYHSGIDYVTPNQCHQGLKEALVAKRTTDRKNHQNFRKEVNRISSLLKNASTTFYDDPVTLTTCSVIPP